MQHYRHAPAQEEPKDDPPDQMNEPLAQPADDQAISEWLGEGGAP